MYHPEYFTDAEMMRCKPPCHLIELDEDLLIALDRVRDICGFPLRINSAYRSVDYEKSKGRKGTSSHTKGLAVDISCKSSYLRVYLIYALLVCGFRRIGIYSTFIHADLDDDKISACWLDDKDVCRG